MKKKKFQKKYGIFQNYFKKSFVVESRSPCQKQKQKQKHSTDCYQLALDAFSGDSISLKEMN